jgi:REP element-mobilizing transposase RayT
VPVHVTLKLARGVPSLRRQSLLATLERCLRAGKARFGMKLVHASFQHDHVHLLCEAENRRALARGVQGLAVRLARALNRALGRKGKLWKERYHARPLRSPRETRRGLAYVLLNGRSHAVRAGREWLPRTADPFSTAAFFDGWLERPRLYAVRLGARAAPGEELCCPPASYLLRALWKQHGLIHPDETPGVGRG